MLMQEKWLVHTKRADFDVIANRYGISPVIARIIRNRDIKTLEDFDEYLKADETYLNSPWLMKDMDKAVSILKIKIASNLKIRVVGDYDVDGVCSSYILKSGIENLGGNVSVDIPDRVKDGYGINTRIIDDAIRDGIDTIITCDNGIAASSQVEYAKKAGLTFIVTDHHEVPFTEKDGEKIYTLPPADAVVDIKQEDCNYPYKEVCGATVAYKVICALYETMEDKEVPKHLIEFAAMATVCDVVDLKFENRTIVKIGMNQMRKNPHPGIKLLAEQCAINYRDINSYHLGFVLGPSINAGGRLDHAIAALEMFSLSEDAKNLITATSIAKRLRELNDERKLLTENAAAKALEIAEKSSDKVLVIKLDECHESIAGIVAGRVKEKVNKPTIIFTNANECLKGSGRSIEGYDMFKELTKVSDLFIKYGGHTMAAGMSIDSGNLDLLRAKLNENCTLTDDELIKRIWIDVPLPVDRADYNITKQIEILEPFGKANPRPVFADKNLKIDSIRIMGKSGNALKLLVRNDSGRKMDALIFGMTSEFMTFVKDKFGDDQLELAVNGKRNEIVFMAVYHPNINVYNGRESVQIIIDRFC